MNQQPLITIVTPSYNQGSFIEKTILSVINQTYKNIQYILVDGGSTDYTMDVVNKYANQIDIIIHEKDNGQADAINKGFKLAKGELVGWINSDDILYPDCLESIVELYQRSPDGAVYYHSKNDVINERDELIETYQHIIPDKNHLLNVNYNVIQQGSFYPTALVKKVNYLDPAIYYSMDLDLWLKLLNHGPIYYTENKPYTGFRKHGESKTQTSGRKFLLSNYQVINNHGAKWYAKNIFMRTYWYSFKYFIKRLLKVK
jgi:glycosyltransferase involved in cell wall biosynthesis